jgi:hypothetical protein
MAQAVLPLDSAFPAYSVDIQLGNFPLRLSVIFNERENCWYLDISDQSDVLIVGSVKILSDWELIGHRYKIAQLPSGLWLSVDVKSEAIIAGRDDLGTRVQVVFDDEG